MMKVIVTENYDESCKVTAGMISDVIKAKPDAKLGLATGGTAEKVYPYLVKDCEEGKISFKDVTTVNLDEYVGIDPSSPQSYKNYMDNLLFSKIDIDPENTYVPSGAGDMEEEIKLFNEKLGGEQLDIQLLGVGVSGHIGFNEPGEHLTAGVHIEKLDESTIEANSRFFEKKEDVPTTSITMGVGDIMKAKKIVLIATGPQKATALKALLMNDEVTTKVPCTMLKMHNDATVVIDKELAEAVGYKY